MSEDDSEKIADRALVPCLFSVNTLEFAAASEKEMLDTKLFAFVVSVIVESIEIPPATVVMLIPVPAEREDNEYPVPLPISN